MALMMRVNGPTVVKHGSSRGAVRCAAVPVGHLDHAAPVYTHTSTAPSTELVKYVDHHSRFPETFLTLPPPELFQLADLGDKNDTKLKDAQDYVDNFYNQVKGKAFTQSTQPSSRSRGQNVTPDQKLAAVQ